MEEPVIAVVEASTEYVGRWNRLISTTNWEKGRIICQWREALAGRRPAASCTDDAWSRQVANVTPQHVGRLRRVFERFGQVFDQYAGLYWSHFQAAIDWPDAEMYLEGAVQNDWSVSQMRHQRWEAMGGSPELKPHDADLIVSEQDEDISASDDHPLPAAISDSPGEVHAAGNATTTIPLSTPRPMTTSRPHPTRGLGGRSAGRTAAASVRVASALAVRPERCDGPIPPGDSQPQGIRLAGDFPQRRAIGARIAQAVGPGPGGMSRTPSAFSAHSFVVGIIEHSPFGKHLVLQRGEHVTVTLCLITGLHQDVFRHAHAARQRCRLAASA